MDYCVCLDTETKLATNGQINIVVTGYHILHSSSGMIGIPFCEYMHVLSLVKSVIVCMHAVFVFVYLWRNFHNYYIIYATLCMHNIITACYFDSDINAVYIGVWHDVFQ